METIRVFHGLSVCSTFNLDIPHLLTLSARPTLSDLFGLSSFPSFPHPATNTLPPTAFNVNTLPFFPPSIPLTYSNSQYSSIANGPREASFFDDPGFREATRLIELKLHLIPAESMRVHAPPDVGLVLNTKPDYPYPPLFFSGTSRGVNGNEALVEGLVRMGWDGVVRWQFVGSLVFVSFLC